MHTFKTWSNSQTWIVIHEKAGVTIHCYSQNAASFLRMAMQEYDGVDCPLIPGDYFATQIADGTWDVVYARDNHVIANCRVRCFAYYIAALYNSALS